MFEVTYNCNYLLFNHISLGLFVFSSIILLFSFIVFVRRSFKKNMFVDIGGLLVSLGGLSNIYEWARYGCVKDYFNFLNLFKFNIADLLISTGIILVIIGIWKKK
ncbi:signal peptidase II [Patescibacteria group bacterium]|nr:signal peptidase II [Patescibacteria group bacterium]